MDATNACYIDVKKSREAGEGFKSIHMDVKHFVPTSFWKEVHALQGQIMQTCVYLRMKGWQDSMLQ